MADDDLAPTQYLVMEVLAARARLGEPCWPFPTSIVAQLRQLERLGYISIDAGIVPKTVRVSLTDAGRTAWKLDEPYRPPSPPAHDREVGRIKAPLPVSDFVRITDAFDRAYPGCVLGDSDDPTVVVVWRP